MFVAMLARRHDHLSLPLTDSSVSKKHQGPQKGPQGRQITNGQKRKKREHNHLPCVHFANPTRRERKKKKKKKKTNRIELNLEKSRTQSHGFSSTTYSIHKPIHLRAGLNKKNSVKYLTHKTRKVTGKSKQNQKGSETQRSLFSTH